MPAVTRHRYMPRNFYPWQSDVAWSPLSLSSLVAWYDASDTATITASGGSVSQWNDKSGNGWNVTQATGANQPTTGVDTINGLNVLKFAGGSQFLQSGNITQAQPLTFYMVALNTSPATGQTQAIGLTGSCPTVYGRSSQYAFYCGTEQFAGSLDTVKHSWVASFNGASSVLYVDGVSTVAANPGAGTYSANPLTLGAQGNGVQGWIGDIAEIVFQGAEASATDRSNWATYVARWGL